MNTTREAPTSDPGASSRRGRKRSRGLARRAAGTVELGIGTAGTLFERLTGGARVIRVKANATTSALQLLPNSTLQGLAASSMGLGAGFYVAGLPRLVTAAAMAPAMIIGAAIVVRPTQASAGSGTTR